MFIAILCLSCPSNDKAGPDNIPDQEIKPGLYEKSLVVQTDFSENPESEISLMNCSAINGVLLTTDDENLSYLDYDKELSDGRMVLRYKERSLDKANLAVFLRLIDENINIAFYMSETGGYGIYENLLDTMDDQYHPLENVLLEGAIEAYTRGIDHKLVMDFVGASMIISLDNKKIFDFTGLSLFKGNLMLAFNSGIEISEFSLYDYTRSPNVRGAVHYEEQLLKGCEVLAYKLIEYDPPKKIFIQETSTDEKGFFRMFLPPGGIYVIETHGDSVFQNGSYYGGRIIDVDDAESAEQALVILREEAQG